MKLCHTSVFVLALLSVSAWAGGDDTLSGADLHSAHCTRCHGSEVYQRPQRLVNTYAELRQRVQQCELMAELGWFEEEVEAVAKYLNDTFYRFPAARQ